MDGLYYFCIFILVFAAGMLIIAGISALGPPVAEIVTARAVRFFDKAHPKECARVIAKLTASVAPWSRDRRNCRACHRRKGVFHSARCLCFMRGSGMEAGQKGL